MASPSDEQPPHLLFPEGRPVEGEAAAKTPRADEGVAETKQNGPPGAPVKPQRPRTVDNKRPMDHEETPVRAKRPMSAAQKVAFEKMRAVREEKAAENREIKEQMVAYRDKLLAEKRQRKELEQNQKQAQRSLKRNARPPPEYAPPRASAKDEDLGQASDSSAAHGFLGDLRSLIQLEVATKLREAQLDFGEDSEDEEMEPQRYEKPRRVVEPPFVRERPTIGFL